MNRSATTDPTPQARTDGSSESRLSLVSRPAALAQGAAKGPASRMFARPAQALEVAPRSVPQRFARRTTAMVVADGIDLWEEIRCEVAAQSRAAETRRSYAHHEKAYLKWCSEAGLDPWQATPREVARHLTGYLVARDEQGNPQRDANGRLVPAVSVSAQRQRLAAIDLAFEREGGSRPGHDREVKEFMAGMRRFVGLGLPHRKAGIMLKDLRRIATLALCPDPVVVRDRLMGRLHRGRERRQWHPSGCWPGPTRGRPRPGRGC